MADLAWLTVESYKSWANDETSASDTLIQEAINASGEWLNSESARNLTLVDGSTVASARSFRPNGSSFLNITDAAEITSVVENGTTLTEDTHFQAEPFDNLHEVTGAYRPYDRLTRLDANWYTNGPRPTVTVTAKWGWSSIPAVVVTAARVLTSDWLANRQVRLGVVGSTADGFSIGLPENPNVKRALSAIEGRSAAQVA